MARENDVVKGAGGSLDHMKQLLLESMPTGVILCDPDGTYLYINPAARSMFSQNLTGAEGTSVHNCHPTGLQEKVDATLEAFRSGQKRIAVADFTSGDRTLRETMVGLWNGEEYLGMACVYQDTHESVKE